ncbi:hypothetical protein ZOSMA_630G00010 [Zostera marina]|uniref:PGG domain-containing protein n=1 Tax=Zostera marina TaxID=29655 RepID=A0A0K9NT55_ZOSMR|nr:hypothetical protein ZOSMA_630G00010 [Zostera marina]
MVKELVDSRAEFSARRLDLISESSSVRNSNDHEIRNGSNDNLIAVAVLIFTLSFAAGFTLPGGYISDSSDPNNGAAVLTDLMIFKMFLVSNTMALVLSLVETYCLIQDGFVEKYENVLNVKLLLRFFITMIMIAFGTGTYAVISPDSKWLAINVLCMSIIVLFMLIHAMLFTKDSKWPAIASSAALAIAVHGLQSRGTRDCSSNGHPASVEHPLSDRDCTSERTAITLRNSQLQFRRTCNREFRSARNCSPADCSSVGVIAVL